MRWFLPFLAITLIVGPVSAAAAPSASSEQTDLSVCDALMAENDALGKRMETQMIAMGQRLGKIANEGIRDAQAYNAIQSQVGKLNWIVPGLGTVLDQINKTAMDVRNKKRQLQVDRERVAATLSVDEAVSRMLALSNELILNDCAQL
jgi:hypothetical protein